MITGLEAAAGRAEVTHAGTARNADGQIVTAGGRVLNVTALGADAASAREAAYAAADMIQFEGRQMRRDIALRVVAADRMSELPRPAPETFEEPEVELEALEVDAPRVGIVMGSKSDLERMEAAEKELIERGIRCEVRVMSAHREPDKVADYARNARMRGIARDHRRRRSVRGAPGRRRGALRPARDRGAAHEPDVGRRRT